MGGLGTGDSMHPALGYEQAHHSFAEYVVRVRVGIGVRVTRCQGWG